MAQANPPKILLSSIFLIVAIVLGYFFVWPQYTEYQQKLQELAAKNQFIQTSQEYYQKVAQDYENLNKLNWPDIKEKIEVNFCPDVYFVPLTLSFFQDKVRTYGDLYLSSINFNGPTPLKAELAVTEGEVDQKGQTSPSLAPYQNLTMPLAKTEFDLSLFGSYDTFKKFLKDLENQALVIKIESLSFSASSAYNSQSTSSTDRSVVSNPVEGENISPGSFPFSLKLTLYSLAHH